jgi:hypothetical protein
MWRGVIREQPVRLGGASALVLKDANAKVGFAEFKGDGLGAATESTARLW